MKKQCLNCGSFENQDVSTCSVCKITNQFRAIQEETPSIKISQKMPVGHCPNCKLPLVEADLSKCPQCNIVLKKKTTQNTKTSKQNGQFFRNFDKDFDRFKPNFSLT